MVSLQQTYAFFVGIIFTVLGIAGFFVTNILVLFGVNQLHNIIHLVTGVIALICGAASEKLSRMFNLAAGVIYLLVSIIGFIALALGTQQLPIDLNALVTLINLNTADNIIHLILSVSLLFVGLAGRYD
jgi:hypothetical protein